ncbi:uncharacterized protein LOC132551913 [Ylistrum balloti]|uniref:uncharacterized protein LOC132551913 n=1 Tax=Ylistrum balloti TaxID=509963 RepID=UPI002905EBE5|nr:uncharacterized protein LOC132551913 [Ylistrum balloti]
MKWTMATNIRTGFFLLSMISVVYSTGTGNLRLLSYDNPLQQLTSGMCCDQNATTNCHMHQCDPKFIVCLTQQLEAHWCSLVREESYVFNNTNTVTFNDTFGNVSNPLHFNFSSWKIGFIITVAVVDYDVDGKSESMDIITQSENVNLASGPVHDVFTLNGVRGKLQLEFSIECDPGYYGDCSGDSPPADKDNTGAVVGGVVGGLVSLLIVVLVAGYFVRKYIKKKMSIDDRLKSTDDLSSGREATTVTMISPRPNNSAVG